MFAASAANTAAVGDCATLKRANLRFAQLSATHRQPDENRVAIVDPAAEQGLTVWIGRN